MPKPKYSDPYPFSQTIGLQIKEARNERKLTGHKFERQSGVSRRHLAELERGANVTLQVTFKAMGALGLTELTHSAGARDFALRLTHTAANVHPAELTEAADTMEQAAASLMELAARLRAALPPQAPAERSKRTPEQQVAALLDKFSNVFQDLDANAQVDLLRQLEHAAGLPPSEPPIASAPQRRKRKSRTV